MSQEPTEVVTGFVLDSRQLTKSAVTAIRVAFGIGGIATLAIGLLMAFSPSRTASAMAWMLGVYWIIAGVVYVAIALFAKGTKTGARVLDLVLGVVMLIAGIIVSTNPSDSAMVLGIFLGFYIGVLWVVEGAVTLLQSGDAPSRAWAIFFGVLSIVAGIALFTSPLWGIQLLFLLTAIGLIALGIVQLIRAFTFGRNLV
ncbi:MAG: DUF308 domain-containing protein [Propionibacteriaceae bacterium]|nr:DUF308 domain-containing protein [Propionibacteriaceae bacterium]